MDRSGQKFLALNILRNTFEKLTRKKFVIPLYNVDCYLAKQVNDNNFRKKVKDILASNASTNSCNFRKRILVSSDF